MKAFHSVICDRAYYNPLAEKLDCWGITEKLRLPQFPCQMSFTVVFWLKESDREQSQCTLLVRNHEGKVIGGQENPELFFLAEQRHSLLLFKCADFPFQRETDSYTLEIWQAQQKICDQKIEAIQAVIPQPLNETGDRGYVELY